MLNHKYILIMVQHNHQYNFIDKFIIINIDEFLDTLKHINLLNQLLQLNYNLLYIKQHINNMFHDLQINKHYYMFFHQSDLH